MLSFALLLKKLISFFILIITYLVLMFSFLLTNFKNYDIIIAEMLGKLREGFPSLFLFIYVSLPKKEAFFAF